MARLTLDVEELALESFDATAVQERAEPGELAQAMMQNTQQVKCTYFCTYPTGFC